MGNDGGGGAGDVLEGLVVGNCRDRLRESERRREG